MSALTWFSLAAAALFGGGYLIWCPLRLSRRQERMAQARKDFHIQRERLEYIFVQRVSTSGKPRGLSWADCDFEDGVAYACDRLSGELSAFVGMTISFEAIAGGGMEEIEAVSNVRSATAVFHFDGRAWQTQGRVIFNLNPTEAIEHFREQLVMIAQEAAHQA